MDEKNNTKICKLKKSTLFYEPYGCHDKRLYILAKFLANEVFKGMPYDFFTKWLKGDIDNSDAYGNAYGLEGLKDKVYVCYSFDNEEKENCFITTKEKMLDIINRWMDIARTVWIDPDNSEKTLLPDEIIITQIGDDVKIERSDGFDPDDYRKEKI